jgi:hypothetical protein
MVPNASLRRCLITGAAALMWLLMTAGTLSADTFDINVTFPGGFTGSGSFNTDGFCTICGGPALTNFVSTVDDDTFTAAEAAAGALTYARNLNQLNSATISGGDHAGDTLEFIPTRAGQEIVFIRRRRRAC